MHSLPFFFKYLYLLMVSVSKAIKTSSHLLFVLLLFAKIIQFSSSAVSWLYKTLHNFLENFIVYQYISLY